RSLGGLFQETSVRLEPSQIAGFNQAYRSLIPESLQGEIAGADFETFDLGASQRFAVSTYAGVTAELLRSRAERDFSTFDFVYQYPFYATPSSTRQRLEYEERSLVAYINRLFGNCWSFGARYSLTDAQLTARLPDVPLGLALPGGSATERAL